MLPISRRIVRVWSDLHFEYPNQKVWFDRLFKDKHNKEVDLVLLGDIHRVESTGEYFGVINELVDNYRTVTAVPGNHEYYNMSINDGNRVMKHIFEHSQAVLLNNSVRKIGGIKLIGSTLWSKGDPEKFKLTSDARNINGLTISEYNRLHDESLAYIKSELKREPDVPCLILTHHAPTSRYLYENDKRKYLDKGLDSFYHTELECLLGAPNLLGWYFGHTHVKFDRMVNGKHLLSNPLGYERKYNLPEIKDVKYWL